MRYKMENENIPRWFLELNDEEIKFVKKLLISFRIN